MTDSQKAIMRQLHDLIKEKFGTVTRFAELYDYKEQGLRRILNGTTKNFDQALYDLMREQCLSHKVTVRPEVVLLTRIIEKHYGGQRAFCKAYKIRQSTLLRILTGSVVNAAFISIAYKAYSEYLYKLEGVDKYVNTMAPGKYLTEQGRRSQNLKMIVKSKKKLPIL